MTAEPEIAKRAVAARPDGIPPLKHFITFVPILATALAVFYDVGYFSGFDINYFSFFTLNEHIVFALGILFFDAATRQVTMIRWDGVTEVVTKKRLSAASKP